MSASTRREARRPLVRPREFAHLDAMRCFAVMVVVVAHAGLGFVPGGSGVTIFFTISGFIITHFVLREHDRSGSFDLVGFYRRRALKLFPPFVVVIGIPTLLYALTRGGLSLGDTVSQFLFYFNWVAASGDVAVLPGSIVVWSLSIEEQFYLVFAAIWLVLVRTRRSAVLLMAVAGLAAVGSATSRLVLHLGSAPEQRLYFGTDARLEAIAIGVFLAAAIAEWQARGRQLPRWIGSDYILVAALVAYIASLAVRDEFFRDTARFTIQAVAAAVVIVWGMVPDAHGRLSRAAARASRWRGIQLLGLASYSIYLAHYVVMRAVEDLALPGGVWGVLLKIVVGTAVGVAAWRVIEVPVLRWRQRREQRMRQLEPA